MTAPVTSSAMPSLFGLQVFTSSLCMRPPTPGEDGQRIVRHGLADVLEWLGEQVGPPPGEPIQTAYLFDGKVFAHPSVVHLLRQQANAS